jgi:hypothetical protein
VLRQIVGKDALACLLGLANANPNIGSSSRIVANLDPIPIAWFLPVCA